MKIKNWKVCFQDRGKWKEVVEKAKTFNQEVQRLEEEELYNHSVLVAVQYTGRPLIQSDYNRCRINPYPANVKYKVSSY